MLIGDSSLRRLLRHGYASRLTPRAVLYRATRAIGIWLQRRRSRRALAECDDRLLRDVGITRALAAREAARPFWR